MKRVKVIAHRGFSAVTPENTIRSFTKAIQAGVDMIELDVHMTSDRELVVIHDETVDRTTTGTGWVKDLSLAKIKENKIRDRVDNLTEEKIPVLTLIKKYRYIGFNVEFKTDRVDYHGIEHRVIHEVNRFGLEDRVIYSSFNHQTLRRVKRLNPDASIAALFDAQSLPAKPWAYIRKIGADAIHPHYTTVSRNWIEVCSQHQIQVRPYTVNHINEMERLVELGVDAIITDYPDRLDWILKR